VEFSQGHFEIGDGRLQGLSFWRCFPDQYLVDSLVLTVFSLMHQVSVPDSGFAQDHTLVGRLTGGVAECPE
jgi:hypothetical protein